MPRKYRAKISINSGPAVVVYVETDDKFQARKLIDAQYQNCYIYELEEEKESSKDETTSGGNGGCLWLLALPFAIIFLFLKLTSDEKKAIEPKISSQSKAQNIITADNNTDYAVEKNNHGYILSSKWQKIYLGRNCDANSVGLGKGNWLKENGVIYLDFSTRPTTLNDPTNLIDAGECVK